MVVDMSDDKKKKLQNHCVMKQCDMLISIIPVWFQNTFNEAVTTVASVYSSFNDHNEI